MLANTYCHYRMRCPKTVSLHGNRVSAKTDHVSACGSSPDSFVLGRKTAYTVRTWCVLTLTQFGAGVLVKVNLVVLTTDVQIKRRLLMRCRRALISQGNN